MSKQTKKPRTLILLPPEARPLWLTVERLIMRIVVFGVGVCLWVFIPIDNVLLGLLFLISFTQVLMFIHFMLIEVPVIGKWVSMEDILKAGLIDEDKDEKERGKPME